MELSLRRFGFLTKGMPRLSSPCHLALLKDTEIKNPQVTVKRTRQAGAAMETEILSRFAVPQGR